MPGNYENEDTGSRTSADDVENEDADDVENEDAGDVENDDNPEKIPKDTSGKPDSQFSSSFSKLMEEVGGAWRIVIFMSFTVSLFAFIYMVILRFLGGIIIWVSICHRAVSLPPIIPVLKWSASLNQRSPNYHRFARH